MNEWVCLYLRTKVVHGSLSATSTTAMLLSVVLTLQMYVTYEPTRETFRTKSNPPHGNTITTAHAHAADRRDVKVSPPALEPTPIIRKLDVVSMYVCALGLIT